VVKPRARLVPLDFLALLLLSQRVQLGLILSVCKLPVPHAHRAILVRIHPAMNKLLAPQDITPLVDNVIVFYVSLVNTAPRHLPLLALMARTVWEGPLSAHPVLLVLNVKVFISSQSSAVWVFTASQVHHSVVKHVLQAITARVEVCSLMLLQVYVRLGITVPPALKYPALLAPTVRLLGFKLF